MCPLLLKNAGLACHLAMLVDVTKTMFSVIDIGLNCVIEVVELTSIACSVILQLPFGPEK